MKKIIALSAVLFSLCASAGCSLDFEPKKLLQKAQDNTAFYGTDFCGDYTIVQEKPGEPRSVTTARMYRRDSAAKWTILITGPKADKGKGYLQFDSNIWFYDPSDSSFTFTSSRDKFQGTNANNSDFAPHKYVENYSVQSCTQVKLGSFDCANYVLKASSKNVDYPEIRLWVSVKDGLLRKREDYSLSGQKLRTMAIPSYQLVNAGGKSYSVPVNIVIQDNLKGKKINGKFEFEKTLISISNPEFKKVEDSVYSKPYLEMMGAK